VTKEIKEEGKKGKLEKSETKGSGVTKLGPGGGAPAPWPIQKTKKDRGGWGGGLRNGQEKYSPEERRKVTCRSRNTFTPRSRRVAAPGAAGELTRKKRK